MRIIKKTSAIILLAILVFSISFSNISNADWQSLKDETVSGDASNEAVDKIKTTSQSVITIAQVIGVGIAVIMLVVLAMKYMISAPNERAEIKKHAVIYIIGAVVLFASVGILEIIKNFAEVVNK
ncbi:MAG: pilin [Clostridia bacterium]|nr:pilin [Clostridia bacterium]